MQFSRTKAQMAQNRESLTIQPKEQIGIGQKSKIVIENYLGGQYFSQSMMCCFIMTLSIFVKANIVKMHFCQVVMI